MGVPYKGSAQAVVDLISGHVQIMFGAVPTVRAYAQSGQLRAVAITSPKRWNNFPDLPTVAETLPGFEAASWYGVLAPAGTPPEIVAKLHRDIVAALQSPEVNNFIVGDGFEAIGNTPEEFKRVIADDMKKWGALIRSLPASGPAKPGT
jgi:tripartite-type tricarboxylate transporter receptor subunit TctC